MAFVPSAVPCLSASRSAFVCTKPATATAAVGLHAAAAAGRSRRTAAAQTPRMVAVPLLGEVEPLSLVLTAAEVAVAVAVGSVIVKFGAGLISAVSAPPPADTADSRRSAAAANDGVLGLTTLKPEVKKRVSVAMKTSKPTPRDTTAQSLAALEAQAQSMFPKE